MMAIYTHVTPVPLGTLCEVAQASDQWRRYKPVGLWYSVDGDWERWCADNDYGPSDPLIYRVALDPACRILHLTTPASVREFTRAYEYRNPGPSASISIDWPRLASEYDGIECAPYCYGSMRFEIDLIWYYGWDCDSGCLWRPRATQAVLIAGEPASR